VRTWTHLREDSHAGHSVLLKKWLCELLESPELVAFMRMSLHICKVGVRQDTYLITEWHVALCAASASCKFRAQRKHSEANVPEDQSTYEIFRSSRIGPIWVETISDLVRASERMEQLAVEKPDSYFVVDRKSQAVVARIDRRVNFGASV
jgi:hypothetical protein